MQKLKRILTTILWIIVAIFSYEAVRQFCAPDIEILPVADRQRIFYKLGYLERVDGRCGPKTHFAQRLYEHDWEAVKEWKARQE